MRFLFLTAVLLTSSLALAGPDGRGAKAKGVSAKTSQESAILAQTAIRLRHVRQIKQWLSNMPGPRKKSRQKMFAAIENESFPPLFATENSLFVFFTPRGVPEIFKLERTAWVGGRHLLWNGRDISRHTGETEERWLERVFPGSMPSASASASAGPSPDWLIPSAHAQAQEQTWDQMIRAAIAITVSDVAEAEATEDQAHKLEKAKEPPGDPKGLALKAMLGEMNFQCNKQADQEYHGTEFNVVIDGQKLKVRTEAGNQAPLVRTHFYVDGGGSSKYVLNQATGSFKVSSTGKAVDDWKVLADPLVAKLGGPRPPSTNSLEFKNRAGVVVPEEELRKITQLRSGCEQLSGTLSNLVPDLMHIWPKESEGITREDLYKKDAKSRHAYFAVRQAEEELSEEQLARLTKVDEFLAAQPGCLNFQPDSCARAITEKCLADPNLRKVVEGSRQLLQIDDAAWVKKLLTGLEDLSAGDVAENFCFRTVAADGALSVSRLQDLEKEASQNPPVSCAAALAPSLKALDMDLAAAAAQQRKQNQERAQYGRRLAEFDGRRAARLDGALRLKDFANSAVGCCRTKSCRETLEAERAVNEEKGVSNGIGAQPGR